MTALALGAAAAAGRRARPKPWPAGPDLAGTRLDINATGEVDPGPRPGDHFGRGSDASADRDRAIEENAARMERVRAALKRAGIADRDIQTQSISLNPEYHYEENQPPR